MIEKVARAMFGSVGRWEDAPSGTRQVYTADARAAIEAIEKMGFVIVPRVPTEAMIEAGRAAWLMSASDYTRLHESIGAAFEAMIDTALAKD